MGEEVHGDMTSRVDHAVNVHTCMHAENSLEARKRRGRGGEEEGKRGKRRGRGGEEGEEERRGGEEEGKRREMRRKKMRRW